jgi:hypothetical protein
MSLIKFKFLRGFVVDLPNDGDKVPLKVGVLIRVVVGKFEPDGIKVHELLRFFQGHPAAQSLVYLVLDILQ